MYRRSIDSWGSRQLFAVRSSSPWFWYIGSSRHLPKGDIIISFARIIMTYHFVEMVLAYANFLLIICQANCTLWISPCFCLFCLFFSVVGLILFQGGLRDGSRRAQQCKPTPNVIDIEPSSLLMELIIYWSKTSLISFLHSWFRLVSNKHPTLSRLIVASSWLKAWCEANLKMYKEMEPFSSVLRCIWNYKSISLSVLG